MASNMPSLYISEVGYPSPTSSQNLGSKRAQYPPKWAKISINRPKNQLKNPKPYNKTHSVNKIQQYIDYPPKSGAHPQIVVTCKHEYNVSNMCR
jgi:hypothetical protein